MFLECNLEHTIQACFDFVKPTEVENNKRWKKNLQVERSTVWNKPGNHLPLSSKFTLTQLLLPNENQPHEMFNWSWESKSDLSGVFQV